MQFGMFLQVVQSLKLLTTLLVGTFEPLFGMRLFVLCKTVAVGERFVAKMTLKSVSKVTLDVSLQLLLTRKLGVTLSTGEVWSFLAVCFMFSMAAKLPE